MCLYICKLYTFMLIRARRLVHWRRENSPRGADGIEIEIEAVERGMVSSELLALRKLRVSALVG